MAEYFAGGHLRFINGEWRDDNGNVIKISRVRNGKWIHTDLAAHWLGKDECSECTYHEKDRRDLSHFNYCPNCGAIMDLKGEQKMEKIFSYVLNREVEYYPPVNSYDYDEHENDMYYIGDSEEFEDLEEMNLNA